MKIILPILILLISLKSFGQIDTTQDFKERFYKNELLITNNSFKNGVKHGYWIEFYDRKWNETDKRKRKFHRLIEYENGLPIGKVYDFFKSGELQMIGQYKKLNPEIRKGTFIWFSKKGKPTNLSHYTADSLIVRSYYRNGNIMYDELYLRGRDMFSYTKSYSFYKNGNPKWFNYSDTKKDTSYYLSGRKNGFIDFQNIYTKGNYNSISKNRKGELIERITRKFNSDTIVTEKFKNNRLVKTKFELTNKDSTKKYGKYDIITFYQGQVGGNSGVVILEHINKYIVNGKEMTELEFQEYKIKYENHIKKRQKIHYYKKFTKDSILIYEGVFKNVDQPCGTYKMYYKNGELKIRGWYDKKGRKSSFWYYYNEKGELNYTEYYKKGKESEF